MGQSLFDDRFIPPPEGVECVPGGRQGDAVGKSQSRNRVSLHNLIISHHSVLWTGALVGGRMGKAAVGVWSPNPSHYRVGRSTRTWV
jgi:hypothetical protein